MMISKLVISVLTLSIAGTTAQARILGNSKSIQDGPVKCVIFRGNTYDSTMGISCVNTGKITNYKILSEDAVLLNDEKFAKVERFKDNGLLCYAFKGHTYDSTAGVSCVIP